ncbi:hypothetical protein DTL42_09085 [Bremerella cremea]|uniref:histidine kinase n=1 Tax=Bremerella cremea TaxID=1031537 RepID=A0A368KW58_9BACT|nr:histidine kinase [Bremerella cremea]RCS52961.1 hypothetical protein DTL42_09085 [Bremerella cremea]
MQEFRYSSALLAAIGLLAVAAGLLASLAPLLVPTTILTIFLFGLGIATIVLLAISPSPASQPTPTVEPADHSQLQEELEDLRQENRELLEDKAFLQFLKANQERERQLLALDLHDLILPNLTSSLLQLEAAIDRPHVLNECLESPIEMIRTSLRNTRQTMNLLSPCLTQDEGVVAGIQRLVEQFETWIDSIAFRHDIEFDRLTPLAECVVVQLVRDALDGARQCPTTDSVVIDLCQQEDLLELSLTSNGSGPPPSPCDQDREARIRECADFLAGNIEREVTPDSGQVLRIVFPLASAMPKRRNREKSQAFS